MRRITLITTALVALIPVQAGAGDDLTSRQLHNRAAYIPSQCYTRTADDAGKVHNPCFTCHVRSRAPSYISDADLQQSYAFPDYAQENRWTNLFVDRSAAVAAVTDADILAYVRTDNYRKADGRIALAERLKNPPPGWDYDKDGAWSGFVPDTAYRFDEEGFDIGLDGAMTGWRAFAYAPVDGTFWPTNGSTDDVLIRLPRAYRERADGTPDRAVYTLNLAIVESLMTRRNVPIAPADETVYGVDLDRDGRLGTALQVTFDFAPLEGRMMHYVGAAKGGQDAGKAPLAAGLYPLGTEFIHSVRYIDLDEATGEVRMAARMKELRYMKKTRWLTYADREEKALAERKEDVDFPDRLKTFYGNVETGIPNGTGWRLQGFIEDAEGELRPQTFEETVFCIGCHGSIGITDDDTFAFPRKLAADAFQGGWSHWTQGTGLRGVAEPVRFDGKPEYAEYLSQNGAGDEFRGNAEVRERFFGAGGALKTDELEALARDIARLLYPSRTRALALDKAYREIVREQSFEKGRDATVVPAANVYKSVEEDQDTGVETPVQPWYRWR